MLQEFLSHWLLLKLNNKTLRAFFDRNKIKSVAIYGGGAIGEFFYLESINENIKLEFCIDKELYNFYNLTVVRPNQLNEVRSVDLVVVCISDWETSLSVLNLLYEAGLPAISLYRIIEMCCYSEIIIPYCESFGTNLYILTAHETKLFRCFSKAEDVILSIPHHPDAFRKNPKYFSDIYSDVSEYNDEYIENVYTASPEIKKNNVWYHADRTSRYVNVIEGSRLTHHNPDTYDNNVYMVGHCGVYGYGVDDSRTIPSLLQKLLCDYPGKTLNYRVVNRGIWGAGASNPYTIFNNLRQLSLKCDDIVIIFNNQLVETEKKTQLSKYRYNMFKDRYIEFYDDPSLQTANYRPLFIDGVGHLSHRGFALAAKVLFKHIFEKTSESCSAAPQSEVNDSRLAYETAEQKNVPVTINKTMDEYIIFLKKHLKTGKTCNGAIVMNCNPFTKGHRYLIETSSKQVDYLYIFVVEEDRSQFPFKDRFELVKQGTSDLENVIVLPSGKFIISAHTFPEYFSKDTESNAVIYPSKDIDLFSNSISPVLNIKKRFVAKEPFDMVTRQYNQTMKDILPKYGIQLIEYERYSVEGEIISATKVRKFMESNNWDEISKLVPDTTLTYLKKLDEFL